MSRPSLGLTPRGATQPANAAANGAGGGIAEAETGCRQMDTISGEAAADDRAALKEAVGRRGSEAA